MRLAAVDTETANLDGGLLEFAAYFNDAVYEDFLCNPGIDISFEAMATHHITDDMVVGAISETEAIEKISTIASSVDYFVAHNADFDAKILSSVSVDWICTLKLARMFLPQAPSHKLQILRYWIGLDEPVCTKSLYPHRALYDAAFCMQLYRFMKSEFNFTDEEAAQITSEPCILHTVPFGKYKGKSMKELAFDFDYCDWLFRNTDVSDDLSFSIDWYRNNGGEK